MNFATIHQFSEILVLFWKKSLFILSKRYSKGTYSFQNFKSYIFALLTLFFISKVLEVYFDLCLFFSWIEINFAFQKALLLVRPWPFLQPPEAKLLILKGQKYSYLCKFSYELQFAGLGWGLISNWKFWNGKIIQWHWIFWKTTGDQQGF